MRSLVGGIAILAALTVNILGLVFDVDMTDDLIVILIGALVGTEAIDR